MSSKTIDRETSKVIRDRFAPIIAEYGIFPCLLAIADRLTEDSVALVERYHIRNAATHHMAVDLEVAAGAIRSVVADYTP